jgi:hypothetical protein
MRPADDDNLATHAERLGDLDGAQRLRNIGADADDVRVSVEIDGFYRFVAQ